MEDIKVGEYVRTDKGNIGKVYEIRLGKSKDVKDLYFNIYKLDIGLWTELSYIKKHSFNIIDLIEEGDYVNGYKILDLEKKEDRIMICVLKLRSKEHWITIDIQDIKSIVTKEQFNREKYILEE